MNTRPKIPANARNLNACVIGSSGSGKTRFWLTPQLLQAHSSYVVVDPKGGTLDQCGRFLQREKYRVRVFNSIDFSKSMHYNPLAYMVVLLSNLLDNAIEACQQYDKDDKAIHVMAVAQQDFFISVRNTSEPVVIINGSIPTTKPEPQMHGFGLANIRLILEKYSGEYTMFYENGWFQFTADIPFTPIS